MSKVLTTKQVLVRTVLIVGSQIAIKVIITKMLERAMDRIPTLDPNVLFTKDEGEAMISNLPPTGDQIPEIRETAKTFDELVNRLQ